MVRLQTERWKRILDNNDPCAVKRSGNEQSSQSFVYVTSALTIAPLIAFSLRIIHTALVKFASRGWHATGSTGLSSRVTAPCSARSGWATVQEGWPVDGVNLWVANDGISTVIRLDRATGAVVATYTSVRGPFAIAFDGRNIWLANFGSSSVSTTLTQ